MCVYFCVLEYGHVAEYKGVCMCVCVCLSVGGLCASVVVCDGNCVVRRGCVGGVSAI